MHRSGTSSVARAVNLLGAYLGEEDKVGEVSPDNPKGYWEHIELRDLQTHLLKELGRRWDTATPLPDGWVQSPAARQAKEQLAALVKSRFGGQPLWAWKEPQSCLLVPLWREVLDQLGIRLACVFVVRNPSDMASSLVKRDSFFFNQALGLWYHYNLVALQDTAGLPVFFLSYERYVASWEPELRRCAAALGLNWPADDQALRTSMDSFIDPKLRHHQSPPERLLELPRPVQELYQVLSTACQTSESHRDHWEETIRRLSSEFHTYASFFQRAPIPPKSPWLNRTLHRWHKSIKKRLPHAAGAAAR